jgi:protein-disulfide isomerase
MMPIFRMRILLPLLALAAAGFMVLPQGAGAQGNAAIQRQVDDAVRAHARRQAAEETADRNNRVAARYEALANAPGSPVLGNAKGDVTIIVFFDYACPYCRVAEPRLMDLVRRDGRIRLVMKEFPILTPQSLPAARMALAAARQGKYEAFHRSLMTTPGQLNVADMEAAARAQRLDMARLRRDMTGPDVNDEIIANFNLARGIRAFQTPTFIVGRRVLTQDSDQIDFAREVAAARRAR